MAISFTSNENELEVVLGDTGNTECAPMIVSYYLTFYVYGLYFKHFADI